MMRTRGLSRFNRGLFRDVARARTGRDPMEKNPRGQYIIGGAAADRRTTARRAGRPIFEVPFISIFAAVHSHLNAQDSAAAPQAA